MAPYQSVLCAIDLSDLSPRVLYHAAGLAGAAGARLTLVHVTDNRSAIGEREAALKRMFFAAVPYGAGYIREPRIEVETGEAVEAILHAADACGADLMVAGTRARGGLARLLLGSTSAVLLQRTARPTLLVPSADLDIVTIGLDHVDLNFGAVLAAVALTDSSQAPLAMASAMAALARRDLLLMTVGSVDHLDDHAAAQALRERAHDLSPTSPRAVIVRRGEVAQEIARCAVAEQAGLVVMGLGRISEKRGKPGAIAAAVLQTGNALVLAVPARSG